MLVSLLFLLSVDNYKVIFLKKIWFILQYSSTLDLENCWKIHQSMENGNLRLSFMAGTVHAEDASTATLLGMRTRAYKFQPVADIKNITNFELRFQYSMHWYLMKSLLTVLLSEPPLSPSGGWNWGPLWRFWPSMIRHTRCIQFWCRSSAKNENATLTVFLLRWRDWILRSTLMEKLLIIRAFLLYWSNPGSFLFPLQIGNYIADPTKLNPAIIRYVMSMRHSYLLMKV